LDLYYVMQDYNSFHVEQLLRKLQLRLSFMQNYFLSRYRPKSYSPDTLSVNTHTKFNLNPLVTFEDESNQDNISYNVFILCASCVRTH
jgi:hypothetical protein